MSDKPDLANCYVAYCDNCGNINAASVSGPGNFEHAARNVAGFVKEGRKIGTMTVEELHQATWCRCQKEARRVPRRRDG